MNVPDHTLSPLSGLFGPRKSGFGKLITRAFGAVLAVGSLLLAGDGRAQTFTTLGSFADATGINPVGKLVQAANGDLYGMTTWGGANGLGTVFKVTTSGTATTLVHFEGTNGKNPYGSLALGEDGNLYGITTWGGTSDRGTVFMMTPAGSLTTLYSFSNSNGHPRGGLVQGSDGDFYGTTRQGGANSLGTIFKITSTGAYTLLASFNGANGQNPEGSLVEGTDGSFYGTALAGGANSHGTVFKVTTEGVLTAIASFDGINGSIPNGGLVLGADGDFYGVTTAGDTNGTIFKVTSAGLITKLHTFDNASNPSGSLVQAESGYFYGLSGQGGTNNLGRLFRMSPSGTVVTLVHFNGTSSPLGSSPSGYLTIASNGRFYGVTNGGGANNKGTVFELIDTVTPEIGVSEEGLGGLASGSGGINFGSHGAGYVTPAKTFTISNTGDAPLNISGINFSGGQPSNFVLSTAGMSSTVAPGGSTAFTVAFAPQNSGPRSTTLRILSNDTDEAVFTVALSGTALIPVPVSFVNATYGLSQGAKSVSLILRRTKATAAQSVVINTDDGVASVFPAYEAAVSTGNPLTSDYLDLPDPGITVNFPIGESTKTVVVKLYPKTGTSVPNKQFTATLSLPTNGAVIGDVPTATVQIRATDTTLPSLTVDNPSASTTTLDAATNLTYNVNGNFSDAKGISRVTISHNGEPAVNAVLGTPNTGFSAPYSLDITTVLGANTLVVQGYDIRGNIRKVTRNFTVTGGIPLTVYRTVPGSVATKPDLAGKVTLSTTPSRNVTAQVSAGPNGNPKVCNALPTATIQAVATASTGYAFSHWADLPDGATSVGNTAQFVMPGMADSLTAVFIAAPFGAPTGAGTTFSGLIKPDVGTPSNNSTEGYMTCTLTNSGGLTGSVLINGVAQSFVGFVSGTGDVAFRVGTDLQSSLSFNSRVLTLTYDVAGRSFFTATVTEGANVSTGTILRSYYSTTRPVPVAYRNVGGTSGYFTVAFPSIAQVPALPSTSYPQGDGFATMTVSSSGVVALAGKMADGSPFTSAMSYLRSDATCPIFSQFATAGTSSTATTSSMGGVLNFDFVQADSDVTSTDGLLWFRPATASARYTSGWPSGVKLGALGARFNKAQTTQVTLALGAVNGTTGNGKLEFSDGKLSGSVAVTAFNVAGNTVSKLSATNNTFTLLINGQGLFSGSFTPNWASPALALPEFAGVILQKGANNAGFGHFISNASGDADPESGGVTFSHQ